MEKFALLADRLRSGRAAAYFAVGLLAVALLGTVVPHLLLGGNTYFRIHDHLDANAAWARVLTEGGYLFAHPATVVDPIMGGQQRWVFGKPFDLYYLLFAVLPPLPALIVNEIIQRIVAFVGMFALARRHLLRESPDAFAIAALVAAGFCVLPFWPAGNIAVAGTPMVISAFLDARLRERTTCALLIAFAFGLLTNPVYVGVFLVAVLGAIWTRDLLLDRTKALGPALWFLAVLTLTQLGAEYQLIYAALSGLAAESHRVEMSLGTVSLSGALETALKNLITGQYHAEPNQTPVILPLSLVASVLAFTLRSRRAIVEPLAFRLILWLAAALATALVYGFWRYGGTQAAWRAAELPYFNLARFHWLQPAIWSSIFALSLGVFAQTCRRWRGPSMLLVAVLGFIQLGYGLARTDLAREFRRNGMTFAQFTSKHLFDDIRASIGRDPSSYRVASVGFHPSITLLNGFRTVDGYLNLYSRHYKREFRDIISDELEKDPKLRRYFDDWGNRAYIFSADLKFCRYLCVAARAPDEIVLAFDTKAFSSLDGGYLLSVSGIANADHIGLKALHVFARNDSPWRIHLYEVAVDR